jgi:hypothetical protein
MDFLKLLLKAGVVYFCAMSLAHFFSLKYPILFIYYDVPFYAYQDKIISFCAFTYACLFYAAAQNRATIPAALVSLSATVLGLSLVNVSSALEDVLHGKPTTAYWLQTGLIAIYLLVMTILFFGSSKEPTKSASARK